MNNAQLSFSTYENLQPMDPYAVGDILQTKPFGRVVVESVSENIHGPVFVCVSLVDARTCIVLPREIEWRSQHLRKLAAHGSIRRGRRSR